MSLIEIAYLEKKGRVAEGTLEGLLGLIESPEFMLREVPVTRRAVAAMLTVPREDVPDMPDRVIAATAVALAVPVVSRDRKIRASQIETIW